MAGLLANDQLYYLLLAYDKHRDDGCRWFSLICCDGCLYYFPAHTLTKQPHQHLVMGATA